ncbi:MAG: hypothetical protein M3R24_40390 [Chloroflexota bacterium]|nr:hypothetical protein [Chloroflexota bacterium]
MSLTAEADTVGIRTTSDAYSNDYHARNTVPARVIAAVNLGNTGYADRRVDGQDREVTLFIGLSTLDREDLPFDMRSFDDQTDGVAIRPLQLAAVFTVAQGMVTDDLSQHAAQVIEPPRYTIGELLYSREDGGEIGRVIGIIRHETWEYLIHQSNGVEYDLPERYFINAAQLAARTQAQARAA